MKKQAVEILFDHAKLTGVPERKLPLSRNLVTVELIWPKVGTAKKTATREVKFKLGKFDFTKEPWTKRCVFREEIDGHCGIAVSVSEPVSVQKLRQWAKLTAKAVLKEGGDIAASALIGYGDIASAPIDALATMVGEKEAPKPIAQGVIDFDQLPADGKSVRVTIPLTRPLIGSSIGELILDIRSA